MFSQAAETSLSRDQADTVRRELAAGMEAKSITQGDKTMLWLEKEFGSAPEGKRSLWKSKSGFVVRALGLLLGIGPDPGGVYGPPPPAAGGNFGVR